MAIYQYMINQHRFSSWIFTYILCFSALTCTAAELTVQVNSVAGTAVEDAVVYMEPKNKVSATGGSSVSIAQKNKAFTPLVTAIQIGTSITFPNKDSVRHHVYSFSPAKAFELKLYSGVPSTPVVFDKAGTVVLGCNIHDQMLAFIHIVDTPYFAKSDASGKVKLSDLPSGDYLLKVWHYKLKKENVTVDKLVSIKNSEAIQMTIDVNAAN